MPKNTTIIGRLWEHRIVRFACVGVINTLTDLVILNLLVFVFGLKVLVANFISASVSIVISYFWNHAIVFQREHAMSLRLFLKFVVVTGLSILAVQTLIILVIEHAISTKTIIDMTGLNETRAKFVLVNGAKLAAVVGGMIWNFVLYQLVVFRHPKNKQLADDEVAGAV